jgi:hypothetical protein
MNDAVAHQYIDRASGALRTETLYRDELVRFLYGPVREHMPSMFRWLVSARHTRLLGEQPLPDALLGAGCEALWHPGVIALLLAIWVVGFVYYGRSTVTGADLSLHVCHDRI